MNKLPLTHPAETQQVLKKAISANRALANLNGVARIIPNSAILINSLMLQEAKEVQNYREALLKSFSLVQDNLTPIFLRKGI